MIEADYQGMFLTTLASPGTSAKHRLKSFEADLGLIEITHDTRMIELVGTGTVIELFRVSVALVSLWWWRLGSSEARLKEFQHL